MKLLEIILADEAELSILTGFSLTQGNVKYHVSLDKISPIRNANGQVFLDKKVLTM